MYKRVHVQDKAEELNVKKNIDEMGALRKTEKLTEK